METTRSNREIVAEIYEAFNKRDIDALAGLFADDCETLDMGTGRSYRGFEGFMQWVRPFAEAMPDSTATPTHVVADAEWVATEHVGRGTHTGPWAAEGDEIPASGRAIEIRFGEFFALRDGQVTVFRAYWDRDSLLRQMRG